MQNDTSQRLQKIEIKQSVIENSISDLVKEIKEQNKINTELTKNFAVWAEKHDMVSREQLKAVEAIKEHHKEIAALKEFKAASEPLLNSIRTLISKIVTVIIMSVGGSSIAVAAIVKYMS